MVASGETPVSRLPYRPDHGLLAALSAARNEYGRSPQKISKPSDGVMKPSDHPEFFRLPPPEGRSRESTIVLDARGRFRHDGSLVEHAGMARAFASWIGRHPDDGRYILNNGWDWTYFQVEDVPFFVISVRDDGGRPILVLSDGTEEALDPARLRAGADDALYVSVKGGVFEARFSREGQLGLAPWISEGADGQVGLLSLGVWHPLPSGTAV
jgi:hypothetical protein